MAKKGKPFMPFVTAPDGSKYVNGDSIGCGFWVASYDSIPMAQFDKDDAVYIPIVDAIRWAERELSHGINTQVLSLAIPKMKQFQDGIDIVEHTEQ